MNSYNNCEWLAKGQIIDDLGVKLGFMQGWTVIEVMASPVPQMGQQIRDGVWDAAWSVYDEIRDT